MATPFVENENGSFLFDIEIRRWVCVRGKIPGSVGNNLNHCVPLSYGSDLTREAYAKGITREDMGYEPVVVPEEPKEKKERKRKAAKIKGFNFTPLF